MSLLECTRFAGSKCWPRLHALPPAKSYSELTVQGYKASRLGIVTPSRNSVAYQSFQSGQKKS